MSVKKVAIIGAGAAGAASAAALKAENYFDEIKVFERRSSPGGTWIYDANAEELPIKPGALPTELDPHLPVPQNLPTTTAPCTQQRFDQTPIYAELTTNVPDIAMSFTDVRFAYGPFVPHHVPRLYIENYFAVHGLDQSLVLNSTVEDVERLPKDRWRLVLRTHDPVRKIDEWWEEEFDALILANGHYSVPFVPSVRGLPEYIAKYPGKVLHSKTYRSHKAYQGQRVLVIGNSASGFDIAHQLLDSARKPVYVSRRSRGRWGGNAPEGMEWMPVVTEYRSDGGILFEDGTVFHDIDSVVYCTGYKPSYPFWKESKNGRPLFDYKADHIIHNFQHTFVNDFPTLAFVGFPRVLTFRSFEYQAIAIARLWSGRNSRPLPPAAEQAEWLRRRAELTRREHRKFSEINWDDGETMDWFRWLFKFAGLPELEGHGRCPPVLGDNTKWAIEHIKKYPEFGGRQEIDVNDRDWEMVENHEDTLFFI